MVHCAFEHDRLGWSKIKQDYRERRYNYKKMLRADGVEYTVEKHSVASSKSLTSSPGSCIGSARTSRSTCGNREHFEIEGETNFFSGDDQKAKGQSANNEDTDDSSPSDLKRRLQDLSAQNESSQVVDRAGALRFLRRKRDCSLHMQDLINSIVEQDEPEVFTDSSSVSNLKDARARRRAKLCPETLESLTRSSSSKGADIFDNRLNDPISDECKSAPEGLLKNYRRDDHRRGVYSDGSGRPIQRRKQLYRQTSDECSSSPDGKITRQIKSLLPSAQDKCWGFFDKLEKYRSTPTERSNLPTGISIKNLTSESDNDTGNEMTSARLANCRHTSSEPLKFFGFDHCDVDVVSIDLSSSPERVSEETNSRRLHSDRTITSPIQNVNGYVPKCLSDRPFNTVCASPSVRNTTRSDSSKATKSRTIELVCANEFFGRGDEGKMYFTSTSRSPDSVIVDEGCFKIPLLDIRSDEFSRSFSSGSKDGKFDTHVVSPASSKLYTKEEEAFYGNDEFTTEGFKNDYDDDTSSRCHTHTLNTPTFPNLKETNRSSESSYSMPKNFFAEDPLPRNMLKSPTTAKSSVNDKEVDQFSEAHSKDSQSETMDKKSTVPTPTESNRSAKFSDFQANKFDIFDNLSKESSGNVANTEPSSLRSAKKYLDPIPSVPASAKKKYDNDSRVKTDKFAQCSNSRVSENASRDYLSNERSMTADNLSETDNGCNLDYSDESNREDYEFINKSELGKSKEDDDLVSDDNYKSVLADRRKDDFNTVTKKEGIVVNFECGDERINNQEKIVESRKMQLPEETGGSMTEGLWNSACAIPTKVVRPDGVVLFASSDMSSPVMPAKTTASASKLTSLLEAMKKETQDRFPFTISESTSRKSIKVRVASDDDIARQMISTSEDSLDKKSHLKVNSCVERVASQSYDSTPITQWISSSCQTEREKVVPRMKKFIRQFSARLKVSDKSRSQDSDSMKIIYENGEYRPECSSPIEIDPARFRQFLEKEQANDSEISSGKTVKSKKNERDLSIPANKIKGKRQQDSLWLQDLDDEDFAENENPLNLTNEKNPPADCDTDRYSIFLAKSSASEHTCFGENREKSNISSTNLTKRAFESDDEFDTAKTCCGFHLCRQYRSLIKKTSFHHSRVKTKT